MIDRFKKKKTIGDGGLSVMDLMCSLWKYLIDTENMFDFLCLNLDVTKRRDLIYTLTMKRYKFNWLNPTGHWRLNLADKVERAIMMQLIAINNSESEFSRTQSGRMDTSQQGNWFNFRNEKLTTGHNQTTEIIIDKDFVKSLSGYGIVEFDYVSTSRPHPDDFIVNVVDTPQKKTTTGGGGDDADHDGNGPPVSGRTSARQPSGASSQPTTARKAPATSATSATTATTTAATTNGTTRERVLRLATDDDLYYFMQQLGLSSRAKTKAAQAIYTLMDLQLASTKYYFLARHIIVLLDAFDDSWDIQAKVVIAMFSRIKDLHNMDLILRTLSTKAQLEIFKRIGCLNLINPLKISFDYVLCLKYQDNRTWARQLMELASFESADQIMEDPTTDLPVATLYGSMTRVENDVRPEVMRFTYADFGVRTNNVLWHRRRDLLSRCLVGTQPIDDEVYQTISMFKELEAAGALLQGPIDQQYASYQKSKRSNLQRVVKNTKSMVNMMRLAKDTFTATVGAAASPDGGGGLTSGTVSAAMSPAGAALLSSLSPIQTSMATPGGVVGSPGSVLSAFSPQKPDASMSMMSPMSQAAVVNAVSSVNATMVAQRKAAANRNG